MMRVIFVLDKLDTGGLQRVNVTVVDKLRKSNDVKFVTIRNSKNELKTEAKVTNLIDTFIKKMIYFFLQIINYFSKLLFHRDSNLTNNFSSNLLIKYIVKNSPECVVLNGPSLVFGKKLKKTFPNLKVIMWMHNNSDVYLNSYFKNNKIMLISSMKFADKIVTLNKDDLLDYSKYSDNVIKIYNPITLKNDESYHSSLNNHVISVVSRIDPFHKGLDYLSEIASRLPDDWKISIAGSGSKKKLKEFNKLITKNNAEKKIVYNGNLYGKALKKHYLKSSIYLMTSRYEGFGLVLLEAMNFGLPIIAFSQSGSKEILNNGKYGILVSNGDVEAMYEKLLDFINDVNLREEYQQKSIKRVKDFSLDAITKQWEKTINNL
ncbi:hypothetical protein ABB45_11740 (plasmid) [Companilactobacillus farciminis]|nr:hypothetical protein ABB45_11740 [Companilactobacillus farciminis]